MTALCYTPPALIEAIFRMPSLSSECLAALGSEVTPTDMSLLAYLGALSLTCLFEGVIYAGFAFKLKPSAREMAVQTVALNLATHPLITWLFPVLAARLGLNMLVYLSAAETFAPAVEAVLLRTVFRYPWRFAIPVAVLANLLSWWLGLGLQSMGLL